MRDFLLILNEIKPIKPFYIINPLWALKEEE